MLCHCESAFLLTLGGLTPRILSSNLSPRIAPYRLDFWILLYAAGTVLSPCSRSGGTEWAAASGDGCLDNLPESFQLWTLILAEQALSLHSQSQIKTNQACFPRLKFSSIKSATTQLKGWGGEGRADWNVEGASQTHHQGYVPTANQHCSCCVFWCIPGSPSQHPCSWMTPFASGLGSGSSCHLLESKVKVCWEPFKHETPIFPCYFPVLQDRIVSLEAPHWGLVGWFNG